MMKSMSNSGLYVVLASAAFLFFQWLVVGLIPAQVLMVALFLLLYFAHDATRRLAVALLPFVVFEVSYDWMRLCPNYLVSPVDVRGIYETEASLFGITAADGTRHTLCDFFYIHHWAAADLLAGLSYLCWVPGPMAVGLWLYFSGRRRAYLHFAMSFLTVNWLGFAIYYIHPAAPPWYVIEHGFEVIVGTGGSAAGLSRFDEIIGLPVFSSIYVNNSNIFAAVPSLHAAYMLVATLYAAHPSPFAPRSSASTLQPPASGLHSKPSIFIPILCSLVTAGIWLTAVYTCHHYVIDVLLGIATAIGGVCLFEYVIMRFRPVRRFMAAYEHFVTR